MGHELTKNDIKKMEEEIEYRIHEVRKAALDDVKETRAQGAVSYTHLRAHETDSYLVCRLLLEKKKKTSAGPLPHLRPSHRAG